MLKGEGILSNLTYQELQQLEERLRWAKAPVGSLLIESGTADTSVFLLVEGRARIVRFAESGREISFADVVGPVFIGDLAAMTGQTRAVNVTLLTPGRYSKLSERGFKALLLEMPALAVGHIQSLSGLVRDLSDRVFLSIALPLRDRLIIELLRMAREAGAEPGDSVTFDPAPSHYDISTRVGSHREAVTRGLNALAKQGILSLSRNRFIIHDIAKLSALAPSDASEP